MHGDGNPTPHDAKARLDRTRDAMRLLVAGDIASGLDLYRGCLSASDDFVPIGMHLRLLESTGLEATAAQLRQLALAGCHDISVCAGRSDRSSSERAREYEALFAAGAINARMLARYLAALNELGRRDSAERIFDQERLIRKVELDVRLPDGRRLAPAVADALLERASRPDIPAADPPVWNITRLRRLDLDPEPAFTLLMDAVRAEARRYLDDWAAGGHPCAQHVSCDFDIRAWGLVSRDTGRIDPHIHMRGWVTCVYYPVGAEADVAGGELILGSPGGDRGSAGWPNARIRPEEGLLVLMPSFYTHWTAPFAKPTLRLSVAIDCERVSGDGGSDHRAAVEVMA